MPGFRLGIVKLQRNLDMRRWRSGWRFRLGIVKLQRWLSSREPSCLSVKDLLSTASTAKSAIGRQQQLQPLCYLPCLREQG